MISFQSTKAFRKESEDHGDMKVSSDGYQFGGTDFGSHFGRLLIQPSMSFATVADIFMWQFPLKKTNKYNNTKSHGSSLYL